MLTRMQLWYSNPENKRRHLQNVAQNMLAQRNLVRNWKESEPCTDCGISYPYWIMQADHVRGEKSFNLNKVNKRGMKISTIQEELDKCERVCANCHADRTYRRTMEKMGINMAEMQ